ncbi:MAG: epoxyqueuosine reductase [Clostridia bacterium]|nr:epoxyqueuosine reductase [Clostridia bacterium]
MKAVIQDFLLSHNVNIVRFVNIEGMDKVQSRGYKRAIWFAIPMSKEYIRRFNNYQCEDAEEFRKLEKETDAIADLLAEHIEKKGYSACSQSEESNTDNGAYMENTMVSLLPHKTIALLSGIGWIGKNNLLVTRDYGCALSTCTVLTNAPINISSEKTQIHDNLCGGCTKCQEFCNCFTGRAWNTDMSREEIMNVYDCARCLKCLMFCPWTKKH